VINNLLFVY